jgi:hypothetical protein
VIKVLKVLAAGAILLAGGAYFAGRKLEFFGPGTWTDTGRTSTKGHLGSIRSALAIYYGDLNGVYPESLAPLNPRWLDKIPPAQTRIHPDSNDVTPLSGPQLDARQIPDTGGWYYVTTGVNAGNVGVACTHTDVKGSVWNAY